MLFRSCEKELTDPVHGKITGTVPTWLNGSLLRNGPGLFEYAQNKKFDHIFDGFALIHKFNISNGQVTYQCKFIQSEAYKNRNNNLIVLTGYGAATAPDPCASLFKRFTSIFEVPMFSDNTNITLYPFGDELYAMNESNFLHQINIENLSTERRIHLNENYVIAQNSSHPLVLEDGTVFSLALVLYYAIPYHTIICHPASETGTEMFEKSHVVASIPARWPFHPSYIHSFGITENFYIIIEQPLIVSVKKVVKTKVRGSFYPANVLDWFSDEYTRINVISRKTGKLSHTFDAETFFYFHVIQQFEENDHIIIDICTYEEPSLLNTFYIKSNKKKQSQDMDKSIQSKPKRFVLPLYPEPKSENNKNLTELRNSGAKAYYSVNGNIIVEPEAICDNWCEVPRINDKYLGKPYKYFYAVDMNTKSQSSPSLVKVDTTTKEVKVWTEPNCHVSEPIFISSPNAEAEDDGVILASLIWGGEDTNHVALLILNATDFQEIGRVDFHTSTTVSSPSFHGWFVPFKS